MLISSGSVSIVYDFVAQKAINTGLTASVPVRKTFTWALGSGVGADQANEVLVDVRTLGSAAADVLDFSGTLLDMYGDTFVLAKLKCLTVFNRLTNTTSLTISVPANGIAIMTGTTPGLRALGPGDAFTIWNRGAAGIPVTAGTLDLITITNGAGASNTYDLIGLGTDA